MRVWLLPVLVLTGCPDPGSMPDMSGGTHFCTGPESVPNPYKFNLTVAEGGASGGVVSGAQVEVRARADDSVLAQGTTGASGKLPVTLSSDGKVPFAYIKVTAPGHTPTIYEVATGLWSIEHFVTLYPPEVHRMQAMKAGVTWDESKTLLNVNVRCASTGMSGARVEISPGSKLFYDTDTGYDGNSPATLTLGAATDFNVPPGPVEVRLTFQMNMSVTSTRADAGTYHFFAVNP